MSFNDNAQLDTSQVESGGSGGFGRGGGGRGGGFPGGIQVGGGIGGLILLVLVLIFGGNQVLGGGDSGSTTGGLPSQQLDSGQVAAAGQVDQGEFSQCKSGADANKNDVCLIIATVNSVQDYWTSAAEVPEELRAREDRHLPGPDPVRLRHRELPGRAVLLPARLQGLRRRELLPGAAEHVRLRRRAAGQGVRRRARVRPPHPGPPRHPRPCPAGPAGPNSGAVRVELMADCLAGTWVKHATETTDAGGTPLLKPITQKDIQSALTAASAVGDDRIQEKMQGRVTPRAGPTARRRRA